MSDRSKEDGLNSVFSECLFSLPDDGVVLDHDEHLLALLDGDALEVRQERTGLGELRLGDVALLEVLDQPHYCLSVKDLLLLLCELEPFNHGL